MKRLYLHVARASSSLALSRYAPEEHGAARPALVPLSARNKKRQQHSTPQGWNFAVLPLAFKKMIDFCADRLKIIQTEIDNRVTDVGYLIHFLQTINHEVADHTGRDFRLAHFL